MIKVECAFGDVTIDITEHEQFLIRRDGGGVIRLTWREARDLAMVLIGATNVFRDEAKRRK